jgi:hypothetical protein
VLRLAYQIAKANNIATRFNDDKQKAGKEWLGEFLHRHPEIRKQGKSGSASFCTAIPK